MCCKQGRRGHRPRLPGKKMKKASILIFGLIVLAFWSNNHRNELAVWFNSDSFYKPIFESSIDVTHPGSLVRAELMPSYDVRHGFFLTFPCENMMSTYYSNMDGSIHYSFYLNGVELDSETIDIPPHPMMGLNSSGICDIVLFTFDLPYKGHDVITLEVVLETPITKLAAYKDIQCKVSPAYWPK